MEDLGFADRGTAWKEVMAGTFDRDGELPVNPDGGLKSFGHPIGATGLRMLFECWLQLRQQAPPERQIATVTEGGRTLGLTHNLGWGAGGVRELRGRGRHRAVGLRWIRPTEEIPRRPVGGGRGPGRPAPAGPGGGRPRDRTPGCPPRRVRGVAPEAIAALAAADLFRVTIGEKWGGLGLGDVEAAIVLEEVARHDVSSAICCQLAFNGPPRGIEHLGSDALKDRWLPAVADGEAIVSIGITEPDAGSAVQGMRTALVADGSSWRLNGYKNYSTLGHAASGVLVWCRWPGGEGARGIGAVVVPMDRDGVSSPGATRAWASTPPPSRRSPSTGWPGHRGRRAGGR
jgi:hypothetical protein